MLHLIFNNGMAGFMYFNLIHIQYSFIRDI